jgi:hypothetical protein
MTVAQTISGFSRPFKSVKEPLDFLNKKILEGEDNRGILGKMLGGIGDALSSAFSAIGNMFSRKKNKKGPEEEGVSEGCWERLNDKCSEWYREWEDMESWTELFVSRRRDDAVVHPEQLQLT